MCPSGLLSASRAPCLAGVCVRCIFELLAKKYVVFCRDVSQSSYALDVFTSGNPFGGKLLEVSIGRDLGP